MKNSVQQVGVEFYKIVLVLSTPQRQRGQPRRQLPTIPSYYDSSRTLPDGPSMDTAIRVYCFSLSGKLKAGNVHYARDGKGLEHEVWQ